MKKLFRYLISVVFYLCFGSFLLLFHAIQWVCFYVLGYLAQKNAVEILNFFILKFLKILGTQIYFDQEQPLPTNRSIIFVANHQSTYEVPLIIWHLRKHHPKFISKKELGNGIPSVSFNLRHGGSLLIDRKCPEKAIKSIESFGKRLSKKKHSAVIFPEGTRSRNGKIKPFQKTGLLTLLEHMPDALVVPISIGNSWQFAKHNYFPMPFGVQLTMKLHPSLEIVPGENEKLFQTIEKTIELGVKALHQ
tara:strand:- start:11 stop:754 length:744 start_codon:yes stop_codon:yes gene_type:complete